MLVKTNRVERETSLSVIMKIFNRLLCFLWAVLRRLNYICRRFGTLYLFHLHRQIQTPENYQKNIYIYSEQGESLKSKTLQTLLHVRIR